MLIELNGWTDILYVLSCIFRITKGKQAAKQKVPVILLQLNSTAMRWLQKQKLQSLHANVKTRSAQEKRVLTE